MSDVKKETPNENDMVIGDNGGYYGETSVNVKMKTSSAKSQIRKSDVGIAKNSDIKDLDIRKNSQVRKSPDNVKLNNKIDNKVSDKLNNKIINVAKNDVRVTNGGVGQHTASMSGDRRVGAEKRKPIIAKHKPKQHRIALKLYSFDTTLLDRATYEICFALKEAAGGMRAVIGPIPLPTNIKRFTVNRSPHIDKKSREHFELRHHCRLIFVDSSPHLVNALMKLELPAGVEVQIKLDESRSE